MRCGSSRSNTTNKPNDNNETDNRVYKSMANIPTELRAYLKEVENNLSEVSEVEQKVTSLKRLCSFLVAFNEVHNDIFSGAEFKDAQKLFLSDHYTRFCERLIGLLTVSWVEQIPRDIMRLYFDGFFLHGVHAESLVVLCNAVYTSSRSYKLNKCVSMIEEFIKGNNLYHICCEESVVTPGLTKWQEKERDRKWEELVAVIAALPEKMANKLQHENSDMFLPPAYTEIVAHHIMTSLHKVHDRIANSEDVSLQFISHLVGKMSMVSYGGHGNRAGNQELHDQSGPKVKYAVVPLPPDATVTMKIQILQEAIKCRPVAPTSIQTMEEAIVVTGLKEEAQFTMDACSSSPGYQDFRGTLKVAGVLLGRGSGRSKMITKRSTYSVALDALISKTTSELTGSKDEGKDEDEGISISNEDNTIEMLSPETGGYNVVGPLSHTDAQLMHIQPENKISNTFEDKYAAENVESNNFASENDERDYENFDRGYENLHAETFREQLLVNDISHIHRTKLQSNVQMIPVHEMKPATSETASSDEFSNYSSTCSQETVLSNISEQANTAHALQNPCAVSHNPMVSTLGDYSQFLPEGHENMPESLRLQMMYEKRKLSLEGNGLTDVACPEMLSSIIQEEKLSNAESEESITASLKKVYVSDPRKLQDINEFDSNFDNTTSARTSDAKMEQISTDDNNDDGGEDTFDSPFDGENPRTTDGSDLGKLEQMLEFDRQNMAETEEGDYENASQTRMWSQIEQKQQGAVYVQNILQNLSTHTDAKSVIHDENCASNLQTMSPVPSISPEIADNLDPPAKQQRYLKEKMQGFFKSYSKLESLREPIQNCVATGQPMITGVTPNEPISTRVTPNEPISTRVTPNEPISTRVTPNEPISTRVTPNEPISSYVTSNEPIREGDTESSLASEMTSDEGCQNLQKTCGDELSIQRGRHAFRHHEHEYLNMSVATAVAMATLHGNCPSYSDQENELFQSGPKHG